MKTHNITVRVTRRDILCGRACISTACPIQQAVRRRLEKLFKQPIDIYHIEVNYSAEKKAVWVVIYQGGVEFKVSSITRRKFYRFIRDFDKKGLIYPSQSLVRLKLFKPFKFKAVVTTP